MIELRFAVPDKLHQQLVSAAERAGLTLGDYVRGVLSRHLPAQDAERLRQKHRQQFDQTRKS